MKITCADRVSVRLYCDVNFKWHMPLCAEISCAEKNICHFLGPSPSALSGKKFQNMGTYTKWCNAALWIFSAKRARWRSRVLDFFSRIHGSGLSSTIRYSNLKPCPRFELRSVLLGWIWVILGIKHPRILMPPTHFHNWTKNFKFEFPGN